MKKLNRREFLALMGTSAVASPVLWKSMYPFNFLYAGLVNAFLTRSAQAASPDFGFNYLVFLHPGAPPRWGFDSFLTVNERVLDGVNNSEFVSNPSVRNTLKSTTDYILAGTSTTYETISTPVRYKGADGADENVYLPRLWDVALPTWNGTAPVFDASAPLRMRDMLPNVSLIRGFKIDADFGHSRGPSFLVQPSPQQPSITGLVADASALATGANKRLIPSIGVRPGADTALGFRSNFAKGVNIGQGGNLIGAICTPFLRTEASLINSRASTALVAAAMQEALGSLEADAKENFAGSASLYENNRGVAELMEKLKNLDPINAFGKLKNKYNLLVKASAASAPGTIAAYKITAGTTGYDSVPYQIDSYSSQFAVAEFFIKNGLCSSFTFFCGGSAVPGAHLAGGNNPVGAQNDEHKDVPRWNSASNHNWKNRAFMACVNELKKALGPTLWAKTIVQHGAEYARIPNKYTLGSDHSIGGCSTTLVSGAFTSFMPIGNIHRGSEDTTYQAYGTFGSGSAVDIFGAGKSRISFEFVMNSILSVMGIGSPFRDKVSLFRKVGGQWRSNCENPKNIV